MTEAIRYRDDDVALTWSLLNRGKSRKVLEIARRADLQKPGDPLVLEALAAAQLACGKTTDAAETASRLIQLIPKRRQPTTFGVGLIWIGGASSMPKLSSGMP